MTSIPSFIYKKRNQFIQIIFVSVFTLVFILLYKPLNFDAFKVPFMERWGWSRDAINLVITFCMTLIGMGIVAISRILMNKYTKKHEISYLAYILWVAVEIVVMAIIYTIASHIIYPDGSVLDLFRSTLYKTILILTIPYVMTYVFFIWQEKSSQLKILKKQMEEDEEALLKTYIQIRDEKGEVRLSIHRENLLFIEAEDNYVGVWYLSNKAVKNIMVRNTLRKIEEQLGGDKIVRCHRSYIINLDKVKVLRREKEGFFIELGIDNVPDIPISKTYGEAITAKLMRL